MPQRMREVVRSGTEGRTKNTASIGRRGELREQLRPLVVVEVDQQPFGHPNRGLRSKPTGIGEELQPVVRHQIRDDHPTPAVTDELELVEQSLFQTEHFCVVDFKDREIARQVEPERPRVKSGADDDDLPGGVGDSPLHELVKESGANSNPPHQPSRDGRGCNGRGENVLG